MLNRIAIALMVLSCGSGCQVFNFDDPKPPAYLGDTGSETATASDAVSDTDTDVDTDIDADTDTNPGTNADTDTDTDTNTDKDAGADSGKSDSDTGTNTDSDTDTDTCTGEACLPATDSDTYTDLDVDTDTDGDTDTDTDVDTGTDTCTGEACFASTDTDSDSESDTCASPQTCDDLGWECGEGQDTCGNGVTCPECDTGFRCADHTCLECNTVEYCGDECIACDGETPVCSESACVCDDTSCNQGSRCMESACAPCIQDDACGTDCDECPSATPVCTGDTPSTAICECTADPDSCGDFSRCVDGACETCGTTDDACGSDCTDCAAIGMQICDTSQDYGTCVECLEDNDCRSGSAPFNSPLGICTPDKTCTCLVESETGTCTSTSCRDGFACAQDLTGENHFVCLHLCDVAASPSEGMACELRGKPDLSTALVWTPMTTCFAFEKFGEECSGLDADCSVDEGGPLDDGSCDESTFLCTYSCWDGEAGKDEWCPTGSCVDSSNVCEVP